jgi:two-component system, NarL family, response regulator DevR
MLAGSRILRTMPTNGIPQSMRVYQVEDSPIIRERLAAMLCNVQSVEIVGEAEDPVAARIGSEASRPDIVALDCS